ncbi:YcxB family protein [Krasilnikovia sp. MM14-A1259]|uniref:YcxB family protein n=1 Tax=Krasilnikovia sp. MM14-A1259 TaxID=3373539 RepID=UPI00399C97E6
MLVLLGLLGDRSAILAAVIMFVLYELVIRTQMRGYRCTGTVTVTIDESAYHVSAPGRSSRREWSTFSKVQRRGDFWVLRVSRLAAMALPATALTDQQTAEFVALMRDKSLM